MLIDTHCHLNIVSKGTFDTPLLPEHFTAVAPIIDQAEKAGVSTIINVGTSYIESINSIELAEHFPSVYATIGIHPNDLTDSWKEELKKLESYLKNKKKYKIVGIGECGIDKHYEHYNLNRQKDAFKAQIELALAYDVGLVVHTRDAYDETLSVLEEYNGQIKKGIIHCFSEDLPFAQTVIAWHFALGLGGTITYPKNETLRQVARTVKLEDIVLETDAPYLPPQKMRGQKNLPAYIAFTAHYLAELRGISFEEVAKTTSARARTIFSL